MKIKELRELSPAELETKLTEMKTELFNLRFQQATNQLSNTTRIGEVKHTIARIKTILREEELKVSV